jgi:outer membrane protein OmpA-like peptidoglycan-associated protein/tetratricopeptide (TPR) repeat protein
MTTSTLKLKTSRVLKLRRLLMLLACIAFLPLSSFGQIKKGKKLFNEGRYQEAVRALSKDFDTKAPNTEAGILLAKCYFKLLDYQDALDVISIVGQDNLVTSEDRRFYADVLIANDNFSDAYLELITLYSEDQSDPLAGLWLDKVLDLLEWDTIPTGSALESLNGINSIYNEYAPYVSPDDNLWFISDAINIQSVFPASYNNQNMHLYFRTKPKSEETTTFTRPSMLIKSKDYYYHDGPLDEWPDTDKYALTLRDIDAPESGGLIGIYFSTLSGDEDDVIPFKYNETYNTGHPTFVNGNRMIFSSDRPGGFGQMDLWYCDWVDDAWSEPKNFGPIINTPFNEVFPNYFLGRLYYSSDRRDMGYGALDVYYSSKLLRYSESHNLRTPVNSAYDDFGLSFSNPDMGYLSSNRTGGQGGDDIYKMRFQPEKKPVKFPIIKIVDGDITEVTQVEIYDSYGKTVAITEVGPDGLIEVNDLLSRQVYFLKVLGNGVSDKATIVTSSSIDGLSFTNEMIAPNTFIFELLPTREYTLKKKENIDDSILEFEINGEVVGDDISSIEGIPVSLRNASGTVLATTKTGDDGKFKITGAKMGEDYTITTEGVDEYHEIDIYGESGAITQSLVPIGINEFSYTRAAPAALWMAATPVIVENVFAVEVNPESIESKEAILHDDSDVEVLKAQMDEDGFLALGSLTSGKAYRLNMKGSNLKSDNRLIILDGNGDTSQTVRPFDAENYLFEYLLYKDYGSMNQNDGEAVKAFVSTPSAKPEGIYKVRINNLNASESIPYVLAESSGEFADTVVVNSNGVAILRGIDPEKDYTLSPVDSISGGLQSIEVFDKSNTSIYTGQASKAGVFSIAFTDDKPKEEQAEKVPNEPNLLSIGLMGKAYNPDAQFGKVMVFDSQDKILMEGTMVGDNSFSFSDLKADQQYVVSIENSTPESYLMIYSEGSKDSLKVSRQNDGLFYINFEGDHTTMIDNNLDEVKVKTGSKFELTNIYYGFDKTAPKASSEPSMNRLVEIMENNPGLKVEIQSHTDSRGPSNYNLLLSQKRANGVVDYLVSKGIARDRLTAVGKGENQLTNKCSDGVPCSNPEHAKNRRTEFIILSNE